MPRPLTRLSPRRAVRIALMLTAGTLGFGASMLVAVALAKSLTLKVANNAMVINANNGATKQESIVVRRGFAVYTLSGDSKKHPKCTKANGCFGFWPPIKVSSAKNLSKQTGIKGKLRVWHRNGFDQVVLGGHPLYTYAGDNQKRVARGQAINSFGGTWSVDVVGSGNGGGGNTGTNNNPYPMTSTSTPTTPTTPYPW